MNEACPTVIYNIHTKLELSRMNRLDTSKHLIRAQSNEPFRHYNVHSHTHTHTHTRLRTYIHTSPQKYHK